MFILVRLPLADLPVLLALAALVALALPRREPRGGLLRRVASGVAGGVGRAVLSCVAAVGLYVVLTGAGSLLAGAVSPPVAPAAVAPAPARPA